MSAEGSSVICPTQAEDPSEMEATGAGKDRSIDGDHAETHGRDPQERKKPESNTDKAPKSAAGPTDPAKGGTSMKGRKRTKTGCLTCRRRRIKCGEERPTCNNCVKSKRQCEGYTPRVIFKDPLGAFRPSGSLHGMGSHLQSLATQGVDAARYGPSQLGTASQAPLPSLAPRPTQLEGHVMGRRKPTDTPHAATSQFYQHDNPTRPMQQSFTGQKDPTNIGPATTKLMQHQPEAALLAKLKTETPSEGDGSADLQYSRVPSEWSRGSGSSTTPSTAYSTQSITGYTSTGPQTDDKHLPPVAFQSPLESAPLIHHEPWPKASDVKEHQQQWPTYLPPSDADRYTSTHGSFETSDAVQGPQLWVADGRVLANATAPSNFPPYGTRTAGVPNYWDPPVPAHFDSTIEDPDDDYFDVESDEDEADPDMSMTDASPTDLGLMLALSANRNDKGFRSLTNFLTESNVLATYRPAYSASPLMDPPTARIFCHYVAATAPTLSLHNRHAVDPSALFTGVPVPPYQRSLFTYTLPMLALTNQGLLHAQLALASLHIAKLQHTSPTPSLKHYHYALRRVAKAVGHPTKRREVATLAATLLLGFYEVTTAEHNKWNSHLAGARELILDIDFAGMTKRVNAYRAQTSFNYKNDGALWYGFTEDLPNRRKLSYDILRDDKDLDENLISIILGWRTRYNEFGQVIEHSGPPSCDYLPLTAKDIETFEIQCDLFWWYAKQDMIQSIISNNRLLLPFERWSHCPPRAPVGRLDAVYGSMDHLILLFARLSDFAAKDLKRKIKAQAKAEERRKTSTQDRSWADGENAQHTSKRHPQNLPQQPMGPPMYGMMPNPGVIHMPSGFDQSRQDHLNAANDITVKDTELESATSAASREWEDICHALDAFEEKLGSAYQPLPPDNMPPLSTPFGPAIYYETYSIACLWSLFYTARIFITRTHPDMPPAAMAAVGVAAHKTASLANVIGRICAGLQPHPTAARINPSHGAALMDSCMGLFQAGVQYRDAAQRGWTITKLKDIARLTGWQTSALIASGCERSWIAAAEAGKGPPYTRTMNATAKDDRVSGRSRKPNQGPPKDNNDRRYITHNPGTRVYWAMGLLSAEEDMQRLKLDD